MKNSKISRRSFTQGVAGAALIGVATGFPGISYGAKKLKYGTAAPPSSISARAAVDLWSVVRERTSGEIDFEVFAKSLGLGEKDLLEGCALGTVDAAGTAYSGTREFDLFYSPYFFRDAAHSLRVANGPLYEPTRKALAEKYSCHFLGVGRAGPWNLFLRDDLKSFEGLKGRKIRAAQIEGQLKGLKHLGAEPVPIAFNELYGALKSGIVDGCGTLASLAIPMKFYEVCKYIARNDFGMGLDKFWVSSRVWNSWSKRNQQIVQESFLALEPIVYAKRVIDEMEPQYKKWEEINGAGTVLNLEASAAQKKMAPVNKALADEVFGAGTWDKIQKS